MQKRMNGFTFKHAIDPLNAKFTQTSYAWMNGKVLGSVSLCAMSFAHKKVRYPMRQGVHHTDHRAVALSREKLGFKMFVTR